MSEVQKQKAAVLKNVFLLFWLLRQKQPDINFQTAGFETISQITLVLFLRVSAQKFEKSNHPLYSKL